MVFRLDYDTGPRDWTLGCGKELANPRTVRQEMVMGRDKSVVHAARWEHAEANELDDGSRRKVSGTRLKPPLVPEQDTARGTTSVHLFPNDVHRVSDFVDELTRGRELDRGDADELGLALRELLLNAIEHGNLGLSFEDKARALAEGSWKGLVTRRAMLEPYRRRAVRVTASWERHQVRFTIKDEGDGFDWRSLPDPTDPENLLRDNGRGVMMAAVSVDSLRYNDVGNAVTIVKILRM